VRVSETSDLPIATLAAHLAASGERMAALDAYREALLGSPDDLPALIALAALLARLGRDEEEIAVRTRIAVIAVAHLAPEHRAAAVAFELATAGIGPPPAQMPSAYTAALFDAHAAGFDRSLRDDLAYRAPEILHACAARALGGATGLDICDIGCGTGLLGPLLRPWARRLDGVDRSPRMLDEAGKLALYDALILGDLTAALTDRPGAYDLVTAADVLVYVGDLAPVLQAAASALRPGGLFAFTVEHADGDGLRLTPSGRYQHAPPHVRACAAGADLAEVSADAVILRHEQGRPVEGRAWVLRRRDTSP
jgi:predicted TPR repeat methyltransferase